MRRQLLSLLALGLVFTVAAGVARAQDPYRAHNPYLELARSDLRTEKADVITRAMEFTPDEASVFWPIYREYDAQLTELWDSRIEMLRKYAEHYETMTDEVAEEIAEAMFDLDRQGGVLLQETFRRVAHEMSAITAAKFVQLERLMNMVIRLQIAAELPLIQ